MARPDDPGAPASWGMPPLTARPEGLLSSLGIQSGGRYPQHLASELIPTYELGPWYREFNQQFTTVSIPATPYAISTATDYDCGIQVPAGELWIVNRGTISLAFSAGAVTQTMWWTWGRTNSQDGTFLSFAPDQKAEITTGAGVNYLWTAQITEVPFLLRPTVKIRWRSVGRNSATVNSLQSGTVSLAYVRCLI